MWGPLGVFGMVASDQDIWIGIKEGRREDLPCVRTSLLELSLPKSKESSDSSTFKKNLKTSLFQQAHMYRDY